MIRIAHVGYEHAVRVHVEEHQMLLVVADGKHTQARWIDQLILYPGERYNFAMYGKTFPMRRTYRIVVSTLELFPSPSSDVNASADAEVASDEPIYALANLEYESGAPANETPLDDGRRGFV